MDGTVHAMTSSSSGILFAPPPTRRKVARLERLGERKEEHRGQVEPPAALQELRGAQRQGEGMAMVSVLMGKIAPPPRPVHKPLLSRDASRIILLHPPLQGTLQTAVRIFPVPDHALSIRAALHPGIVAAMKASATSIPQAAAQVVAIRRVADKLRRKTAALAAPAAPANAAAARSQ